MIEIYDLLIPQHRKEQESISFFQCGIEQCAPGHKSGPKIRLYSSIHFVLEGEGFLVVNKKKHHVERGQAFLLPANVETIYYADSDNPWKYCWIDFFGKEKEIYTDIIFGKDNVVKSLSSVQQIYEVIKDILEKFCGDTESLSEKYDDGIHLYSIETLSQSLRANTVLYQIIAILLEEESENNRKEPVEYLDQIKNFMDSCFLEINEVADIAERFHLHPNYLTAIFKEKYHISPKKYLLERKIDYASYLLAETDSTVQDIALQCGFISLSSFGRIYKKYKNVSPGTYRKTVREQKRN